MNDPYDIPPPPQPPDMASQSAAVVAIDITHKITKAASSKRIRSSLLATKIGSGRFFA